MNFCSSFGIFTLPISSWELLCVHASAMSILLPSFRFLMASMPAISFFKSPFILAIIIENEVRGMFSGTTCETNLNSCESVTTKSTFFCSFSVSSSSVSRTTIVFMPWSRQSRRNCTCGRIILPLGASESIGTTIIIVLPSGRRLPIIVASSLFICDSFSSRTERRLSIGASSLTDINTASGYFTDKSPVPKSDFVNTSKYGICFLSNCFFISSYEASSKSSTAAAYMAKSVFSSVFSVLAMRFSPILL